MFAEIVLSIMEIGSVTFIVLLLGFMLVCAIPEKFFGKKDRDKAQQEIDKLSSKIWKLENEIRDLKRENNNLHAENDALICKNVDLGNRLGEALSHKATNSSLTKELKNKTEELDALETRITNGQLYLSELLDINSSTKPLSQAIRQTFRSEYNVNSFFDSITANRLNNAFKSKLVLEDLEFSAKIHSGTEIYDTTLNRCNCNSFLNKRTMPCKHMIYLAYSLGLLQFNENECKKHTDCTIERLNDLIQIKKGLDTDIEKAKEKLRDLDQKEKSRIEAIKKLDETTKKMIEEKCAAYPYLAGLVSEFKTLYFGQSAEYLLKKNHPAPTEALRINALRADTKKILQQKDELEYRLAFLYELYPEAKKIIEEQDIKTN